MNIPTYGNTYRKWGVIHQVLKVTANTPPDLTVRVNEGSAWVNSNFVEYAGGSITLVAATAGTQLALIGLRGTQLVAIYSEAAVRDNPVLPANLPIDFLPLAAVVISESTTAIYDDQIQDLRPLFSVTNIIKSHKDLENVDDDNLHPISAVTGLQDVLDTKLTMQDVDDRLKDIVTGDGTSRKIFTLNKNAVGLNSSNLVLEFRRGTQISAGIRWNEDADQMEYTDSEGNWLPMDPTRTPDGNSTKTSVYSIEESDQKHREILAALRAEIEDVQTGISDEVATIVARDVTPQLDGIVNTVDEKIADATIEFNQIQENTNASIQNRLAVVDEKIERASQEVQQVAAETTAKIAQNNADTLASYTTIANNLEVKLNTITEKHNTLNSTVENFVEQFNTLNTNTNESIVDQNEKIETLETDVNDLKNVKANKEEVYTKTETYSTDEIDNNIDASIAMALSSINEALKTAAGKDDTTDGSSETEITELLAQTKQLIADTKAKISAEYTEAIETANTQVLAQAEVNILQKAGIESFDKFASTESVDTLSDELDTKAEEITTTINNNKSAVENSVLTLTNAINNAATEASDNLQNAVEEINTVLDTKADKEQTYTKENTDQLLDEIKDSVYTKAESQSLLNTKADKETVTAQIENLMTTKQDKYIYIPENAANKNIANGYAGLDANGKISLALLPDTAKQATHIVANAAERLALINLLSGEKAFEVDTKNSYIYDGSKWILVAAANWENINLDFNNIINKPNTINGYGITDAYTKAQVDNVVETNLTTATNSITDNINSVKTALESSISSTESAINSKITTINGNIETINSSINTINSNVTTINENIDTINGNINTINETLDTKAIKTEVYTKSDVNSLLNDKVDKTTATSISNSVSELATSVNTKFGEIDESINDVNDKIDVVDAKFTNYATTANVNTINSDLNDRIDDNEIAINTINTNLANYAKSADVTSEINTAIDDVYSDLESYALKTFVTDEINSSINDALEQINTALQNAVDDDSTHGSEVDLSNTIQNTVDLITELNTTTNEKITTLETATNEKIEETNTTIDTKTEAAKAAVIQEVRETVIKEVIIQEVGDTTDLSDLASQTYVNGKIEEVNNTISTEVETLNSTITNKENAINNSITTLTNAKEDKLGFIPENVANKNAVNGYAGLDANGKISLALLPDTAKQPTHIVANEEARLTLTGLISGEKAFETSTKNSYIYDGSKWILIAAANWENINLDFNNIINTPTTINGYGITDAYTKTQVNNAIATATADINETISDTQTLLERKITAGDSTLNSSITRIDTAIERIDSDVDNVKDDITSINNQLETVNTNINKKANAADVYTKAQINSTVSTINDRIDTTDSRVDALETDKATATNVYTKAAADALFATKTALNTTNDNIAIINTDINTINSSIDTLEASISNVTSTYATKTELTTVDNKVTNLSNNVDETVETINGNISIINTNLNKKADATAMTEALESVNTTLSQKADANKVYTKTQVDDLLAVEEESINSIGTRVTTLESTITTKANKTDVYTKSQVDSTFATKTTVTGIDERVAALETEIEKKSNVDDVYTKIDAGNAFAAKATVETITDDIREINEKIEALAATSYVDTELSKKADITDLFDTNNAFRVRQVATTGDIATIFNESDGGGAQCYVKDSDITAFVGVNTDNQNVDGNNVDQAINVQLYAKYNGSQVGTQNYGSRINVNVHGAYYTVGTNKANSAEREIAVKGDVSELAALITTLTDRIATLEAEVEALKNA